MARNNRAEAMRTRERILDSAIDLFYERGVSKASLELIASHAGVTRGAVYVHYENKIALFEALCEEVVLPPECFENEEQYSLSIEELVARWESFLRTVVDSPRLQKILSIIYHRCEWVPESVAILHRISLSRRRARQSVEMLLRREVLSGRFRKGLNVKAASILIVSSMTALLDSWLTNPDEFDLVGHGKEYLQMLLDSFIG